MPFYEYECSKCGFHDEVLQAISDKPLTKCPKCGKAALKKLISAPVFRLKGSGWYETDFKSDKENKRNLAGEDKDDSKSETKAEAKSDSKGESKADAKPDSKPEKSEKAAKPSPVKSASKPASKSAGRKAPARPAKRSSRR